MAMAAILDLCYNVTSEQENSVGNEIAVANLYFWLIKKLPPKRLFWKNNTDLDRTIDLDQTDINIDPTVIAIETFHYIICFVRLLHSKLGMKS